MPTKLQLRNPSGLVLVEDAIAQAADGTWRCAMIKSFLNDSDQWDTDFVTEDGLQYGWPGSNLDSRGTRYIVAGGRMNPRTPGRQELCADVQIGPVWATHGDSVYPQLAPGGRTNTVIDSVTWLEEIVYDPAVLDVNGLPGTVVASVPVIRPRSGQRPALTVLTELARTVGAVLTAQPNNALWFMDTDLPPAATIVLGEDDDGPQSLVWGTGADDTPATLTATWPGGQVTIRASATAAGADDTVSTCAASASAASAIAQTLLDQADKLRIRSITVDVVHAVHTDLFVELTELRPGDMVTITNVPTGVFGISQWTGVVRQIVEKTTITDGRPSQKFTLALEPAPPTAGVVGVARVGFGDATITAGTALGTKTTGGTVVPSRPATTDPDDYPCDWTWHGEVVTVSAPIDGAHTVVGRGQRGTVARAHVAGEPVEITDVAIIAREG